MNRRQRIVCACSGRRFNRFAAANRRRYSRLDRQFPRSCKISGAGCWETCQLWNQCLIWTWRRDNRSRLWKKAYEKSSAVLLAYFKSLSTKLSPNTLWGKYSHLNFMLLLKTDILTQEKHQPAERWLWAPNSSIRSAYQILISLSTR